MNADTRVTLRWPVFVVVALLLLGLGAGSSYLWLRSNARPAIDTRESATASAQPQGPVPPPTSSQSGTSGEVPFPDVVVTLSQQAVERAGIVAVPVETGGSATAIELPAVVEPNAYAQVVVTPLVAGRVTRVPVQLGEHVRSGQILAQIFSPELAEAQTRFISMRAELDAHERELTRTQKLVEIGAASRQELERIHAEHTAKKTAVESARSRLRLLGIPAAEISRLTDGKEVVSTTNVLAPRAGIVTERLANVGLNVDPTARLFTIIDLSTVWVVADLYEKDFSRVRIGSPATITTTAYPGLAFKGSVSYIEPEVNSQTRTAKLRVEMPNPRNQLRLGMYAEAAVQTDKSSSVALVPRAAVQTVSDRSVVYIVDPRQPGRFTERAVRLGQSSGEQVEILTGVKPGDLVVSEGSFFVRAERERLGLRRAEVPGSATAGADRSQTSKAQTNRVTVGDQGFQPPRFTLRAGVPARLTFVRTSEKTCATEVIFPSLKIRRDLPLNKPVEIEFTPAKGELAFVCGMNMLRGTVVVE